MGEANDALAKLNAEMVENEERMEQIKADYQRLLSWPEMFDSSDMEVKKMVAGYIIKRVYVFV